MPWCGLWATTGAAYWWIVPLIGLVFVGVMFFVCFRGAGCMGGRRRAPTDLSGVQRDLDRLKEDVRKLRSNPS